MRSAAAPLLSVSKGRQGPGQPGSPKLRLGGLPRAVTIMAVVLTAMGATLLIYRAAGGVTADADLPWTVEGLEAATQATHGLGGGDETLAGNTLADARARFDKAVALPPPEYRSHAAGMTLSPGAAAAAAACTGEACDLVRRFVLAADEAAVAADAGGCAVQHCPDVLGIGLRPLPHTAFAFGNRCEPNYNRGALEVVRLLVGDGGMRGLEWFTGGSTAWFLARLEHLTSVEAAPGFAAKARAVAEAQFEPGWLARSWDLRVVPPQAPVRTFADMESPDVWEEYCALRWLPRGAQFDVVSVQGFARVACLRRALRALRPQGSLLVLPHAQRPAYAGVDALVPPHWLRLNDSHAMGTTLVWMSIHEPRDGR